MSTCVIVSSLLIPHHNRSQLATLFHIINDLAPDSVVVAGHLLTESGDDAAAERYFFTPLEKVHTGPVHVLAQEGGTAGYPAAVNVSKDFLLPSGWVVLAPAGDPGGLAPGVAALRSARKCKMHVVRGDTGNLIHVGEIVGTGEAASTLRAVEAGRLFGHANSSGTGSGGFAVLDTDLTGTKVELVAMSVGGWATFRGVRYTPTGAEAGDAA